MLTSAEVAAVALVAFHFGALAKTLVDSCSYRLGVLHGWRVAMGDVDMETRHAAEIIKEATEEIQDQ